MPVKASLPPGIYAGCRQLRSHSFFFGVCFLLSLVQSALAISMSGDISISGGARFNKSSLMRASDITKWMSTSVLSDSGGFLTFAAPGSAVTLTTPWFFGSSTPSSVLWSANGFTFDLTSSEILSRGRKSLTVEGTGTVIGNGFDVTAGDWSFTYTKAKKHRGFLFSFTAEPPVGPPPPIAPPPPVGPPPPIAPPPPVASVPDNGSTLALLCFGLFGLVCFRIESRKQARNQ